MLLCAGGNLTLQATADNAALRSASIANTSLAGFGLLKKYPCALVQPSLRKSHQMTEWRSSIEKMNFERALIVEVIKLLRHRKTTGWGAFLQLWHGLCRHKYAGGI